MYNTGNTGKGLVTEEGVWTGGSAGFCYEPTNSPSMFNIK
jgi:hypothetical protein